MAVTYIGQNVYIRPTYIVTSAEFYSDSPSRSLAQIKNELNLQNNDHKGVLSRKALGKMRNAINWLLLAAEPKKVFNKQYNSWFNFKVNFITLTLPDSSEAVDNRFLQTKLLNPFLVYLRKYHSLKNYVWKLEFQKNGKLHVHLVSDSFIHHAKLRTAWNQQLIRTGIMSAYTAKFSAMDFEAYCTHVKAKTEAEIQRARHAFDTGNANGWQSPNSTDIHSIKKINNLAAYMMKYMSKQAADLDKIKGRIWGCNQELSRANTTKLFLEPDECHKVLRPLMDSQIEWKALGEFDKMTGIFRTRGELFFLKYRDWLTNITGPIKEEFEKTIGFLKQVITDQPADYAV